MEIDVCPRWVLAKVGISAAAQPHLAIFLSSWVALLASPVLIRLPHVCLFRTLLGISCPGCGMLHAMAALLKMDIASAWNLNPAALILAGFLGFQLLARPTALVFAQTRLSVGRISRYGSHVVYGTLFFVWICRLFLGGLHGVRLVP